MDKRKIKHLGYYCVGPTITPQKIKLLKNKINENDKLALMGKDLAILSGRTRLRIIYLLQEEKRLCVCDIADILGSTVSAVSHQLKILRISEFVEFYKDAQTIFYSLSKKGRKIFKKYFLK